ncbi:DUF1648 domain-containing protein [uncultured Pigmentiphaga sp.]|mgnify:CR=1 FL=1|uniref:DUF1648 domain-containing protein n=1 Tax=uncultured Pigmentiphaga sp. TaxID=340361 RepID=UPI0026040E9E|nr:DUF1648 domain-containing protein [uncultured Pigmentiphaga sp.]
MAKSNPARFAAVLLLSTCIMLLVFGVMMLYPTLPDRVPAHFDINGAPTRFESRAAFTRGTLGIGLGLPAFLCALVYCLRFLPARFLNAPNAEYWRAPENYPRACDYLLTSVLWLAGGMVIWSLVLWRVMVSAALRTPPSLDIGVVTGLAMAKLGLVIAWIVAVFRRFSKME